MITNIKIPTKVIKAEIRNDYIIGIQTQKNDTVKRYFVIEKTNDKIIKNLSKKEFSDICSKIGIESF